MEYCVFCKIVAGELPSYKVYEDQDFLGFLDIRPLTKGNTLVIPKKHYRWVDDVPQFGAYFEFAKKIGLAAKSAFQASWISFVTIGMEVHHAHIRVIPRYPKDLHEELVDLSKIETYSPTQMEEIATALRKKIT